MRDKVFGLRAKFLPRMWCWEEREIISPEGMPREAKAILYRSDGHRIVRISYDTAWLFDDVQLKTSVEEIGGVWSAEDAQWLRCVLEPMIKTDEPPVDNFGPPRKIVVI